MQKKRQAAQRTTCLIRRIYEKNICENITVITVYVIFRKVWLLGNATHPLSPVGVKIFYKTSIKSSLDNKYIIY